jgi:ABC-type bacteriocin/lantibiotic exporter with double-glycine peptidase domain
VNHHHRYKAIAPLPPNLVSVPPVKQATDFSCGAAATLAVLRYWRQEAFSDVDEAALYGPLQTSRSRGTDPQPMASYLHRALDLRVAYRHSDVTVRDLERAVDEMAPPILDLQAWSDHDTPWRHVWDAGHYVVMVGYDAEHLFFLDPSTLTAGTYAFLPREDLDERWHDIVGERDERFERMAIFVGGTPGPARGAWRAGDPPPARATRLG